MTADVAAAGIDTPQPSSLSGGPSNQPYQAAFNVCPDIALLQALLQAAGRNLNYGTLATAINGLKANIPGDPTQRVYGPQELDGDARAGTSSPGTRPRMTTYASTPRRTSSDRVRPPLAPVALPFVDDPDQSGHASDVCCPESLVDRGCSHSMAPNPRSARATARALIRRQQLQQPSMSLALHPRRPRR